MKVVYLDNNTLLKLAQKPEYVSAFPSCFGSVSRSLNHQECNRCPHASQSQSSAANSLLSIKVCITSLPAEKIQELKRMLGADEIQVSYVNSKRIRVTKRIS